jgi:hypothetical protein
MAVGVPSVEGVTGSSSDVATGLRDLMTSYLSGPSLKILPLDARLPARAAEEAKQKGCGTLLVLSLTRKSGGGGLGHVLGEVAGASTWYLPGGSAVTTAAAGGLRVASSLASSTKPKDELRLDYRIESADGQVQFGPKTEKRKATTAGEDLLTPIVAQAAQAIVTRKDAR